MSFTARKGMLLSVVNAASECCNCRMIKPAATTAEQLSRSQALAALWALLGAGTDAPPQGLAPAARASAGKRALKAASPAGKGIRLDNASAYQLIKRGISSKAVAPLGEVLGLGKGAIAVYLDLDRGTANRRAAKDQLLPTHAAEAVVRFLELDQMACDTFESDAEASRWLRQAHPMLDGETPLQAARTGYGAQRVKDILLAIKYGGVV
jgi:putative toxin-antitoxin system antitoxin component (TIGR02293 family)